MDDIDEESKSEVKEKGIDFYGNQKKQIQRTNSQMKIDQNDYNLGKNTKMVLDFTSQEMSVENKEETKQYSSSKAHPSISKHQSNSPVPNFQSMKPTHSRVPAKQNNFMSSREQE